MENSTSLDAVESDVVLENDSDQTAEALAEMRHAQSMEEYYALMRELFVTTLVLMGIIFPAVWFQYGVSVASNYVLGAFTGMLYLRLLGKNVEKLGSGGSVGKSQIAVLAGVIIAAAKIENLSILPIFLGFLTFKAAIFVYTLRYISSNRSVS